MTLIPRLLACALPVLAQLPAPALAEVPVTPFKAEYEVLRNGRSLGSSRIELSDLGDGTWRWRADTTGDRGMASLVGLRIDQDMRFRWHEGLPRPLDSRFTQRATFGNREVSVRYDWQALRYRLRDRKGEHEHALAEGASDRYGSGVALVAHLVAGREDFELDVAYPDGLRRWRFRVAGEEAVETPSGTVRARRVERVRDADDDDRSTVSWHDPQRGFLMVRMVQIEDGDSTETRLRSLTLP